MINAFEYEGKHLVCAQRMHRIVKCSISSQVTLNALLEQGVWQRIIRCFERSLGWRVKRARSELECLCCDFSNDRLNEQAKLKEFLDAAGRVGV